MTWQLYYQLADRARTLDGVAAYTRDELTLSGSGTAERIASSQATPSLAKVLRVQPALGRWFAEQEGETGAAPTAVLSHGLWARRYALDPGIIGQSIRLNGVPTQVIGVMPATFAFPVPRTEVWVAAQSTRASASFLFTLQGVARLRDGATIATARTEMTGLIADLARSSPNQRGMVATPLPLQESIVGRVADTLWMLFVSVVLVLLVACANVANLFLVRSEARQREVAVRQALGAGKQALVRYFLAESALLSLAGGIVGLAIAWAAVHAVVAYGPPNLPRIPEVRLDGVVVGFTLILSVLAGVAFGAIPLLRVAPLPTSLHENGRGNTASRGRFHARHVLMGGQVALALVLVDLGGADVPQFSENADRQSRLQPDLGADVSRRAPEQPVCKPARRRHGPPFHPGWYCLSSGCHGRVGLDMSAPDRHVLWQRAPDRAADRGRQTASISLVARSRRQLLRNRRHADTSRPQHQPRRCRAG